MYNVLVTPSVSDILIDYTRRFAMDNGIDCANRFTDSFDKAVDSLSEIPQRGVRKLKYIPYRYHIIPFWKHLWLVYQISEKTRVVYIDFLIDDRSDYGKLF